METLRDYLLHYRDKISILKKGYAQEKFRIATICKDEIAELKFGEVTSIDIAAYRDRRLAQINIKTGRPISPANVRLEMSLLSHLYDIALIEWGGCTDNPVKRVRKPSPPPGRERRLTSREEAKIFRYCRQYCNHELGIIIKIALETAMRQGEILSLCWEDVDIKKRLVHLKDTKNGSNRDVPLSLKAVECLRSLGVRSDGQVFSYSAKGLKSVWRQMVLKLNIDDLHFHDLRHEAISRLFELGTLDMMEIAAISGHKSLSMLKRYTHLKAARLVKKLDPKRSKVHAYMHQKFIPYPAFVNITHDKRFETVLPDFNLSVLGRTKQDALERAAQVLSTAICERLITNAEIPVPDSYLSEAPEDGHIVMIEPSLSVDTVASWANATL